MATADKNMLVLSANQQSSCAQVACGRPMKWEPTNKLGGRALTLTYVLPTLMYVVPSHMLRVAPGRLPTDQTAARLTS